MRPARDLWHALLVSGLLLMGCAVSSGVLPSGKDTYSVMVSAGQSGAPISLLIKQAYEEANAFCDARGKLLHPIGTDAKMAGAVPVDF